jgi:hypothetical protein
MRRIALIVTLAIAAGAVATCHGTTTPSPPARRAPRAGTIDRHAPMAHASLITGVHVDQDTACVGEHVVVRVDTVPDRALRVRIANTSGTMAVVQADGPGTRQFSITAEDEITREIDAASGSFQAIECAGPVPRVAILGRAAPADVTASWLDGPCDRATSTYHWDYGDGTSDETAGPETAHDYPIAERAHTYLITVEQRGADDCSARARTTVHVATTLETQRLQAASHAAADGVLAERLARSRAWHAQLGLD